MNTLDAVFCLSVDGVHCRTNEIRTAPSAQLCSHKFNHPAFAYELGISIYENKLVWINGPFYAGVSDITIFRSALKDRIPEGKKVIVDRGYEGEEADAGMLSMRCRYDPEEVRIFKRRVRARHENFNGRIKTFKILDERFRHGGLEEHKVVFEAVCIIQQYEMENGRPLIDP